jgi:hypothetical protein
MKNVYSHNAEDWVEDLEDAIEYAKEFCLYDHDRPTVYIGDKHPLTNKNICQDLGAIVVENMQEWAHEEVGDHADSYLDDLDKDKLKQLSHVITIWLNNNAEKPDFYSVKNVREFKEEL